MTKKQASLDYTPEFELFWKSYPSRWNKDFQGGSWVKRKKLPAFQSWQKLSEEIKAKCLRIVKQIKKSEGGATRDAVTWINERGWDDIEEANNDQHLPTSMTTVLKNVANETKPVNVNNERNRQLAALKGAKND
jgi:hypothetical protein